jgi:hypothetical protein
MTRKVYEFTAKVLREMPTHSASLRAARESCAQAFADAFAADNSKFNRFKFLAAVHGKTQP